MKKGLCIVLSALLIAASFSACGKKGGDTQETKIDENGQVYVEVTDKKGENITDADGETVTKIISKTDEKGQIYVEVTDNKGEAVTDKAGETVTSIVSKKDETASSESKKDDGKTTKKTTIPVASDVDEKDIDTDVIEGFTKNDLLDMTAAKEDLYKEGTTIKKTTLYEDKVKKVLETKKFTLDISVTSEGQKMPMRLTFDKDRMYVDVNMNGLQAGILYMDNSAYILLPNILKNQKICMEYEEADDMMSEIFDAFGGVSSNSKYVGSSKVKVGSTKYTCEEYTDGEGGTFKYYFDGKDWKRYECITEEGSVIYEINDFSGKINEDLFSLKGYKKLDEEQMAKLMGGSIG